jgi:hypothetical protein
LGLAKPRSVSGIKGAWSSSQNTVNPAEPRGFIR